jgi:hypothetical protein
MLIHPGGRFYSLDIHESYVPSYVWQSYLPQLDDIQWVMVEKEYLVKEQEEVVVEVGLIVVVEVEAWLEVAPNVEVEMGLIIEVEVVLIVEVVLELQTWVEVGPTVEVEVGQIVEVELEVEALL